MSSLPSPSRAWLAGLAVAAIAGCGSSSSTPAPPARPAAPEVPTATECRTPRSSGATQAQPQLPAPGAYEYTTSGVARTVSSVSHRAALGPVTRILITPARRFGAVRCLRIQRRYSDTDADTATVLLQGESMYLLALSFQNGDSVTQMVPNIPLQSLAPDQVHWAGSYQAQVTSTSPSAHFTGTGAGTYVSDVVGRRVFHIEGHRVRAIGVSFRTAFRAQDLRGTMSSVEWLSPDRHLLIKETVQQVRGFGGKSLRMRYTARLRSLTPAAAT